jgi:nitrogen fixation protein NifU and related proteins
MDEQKGNLHEETIRHETVGEEAWSGGDASHHVIELQPVSFSAKAIQHGRHPTHVGRMEQADAHASKVGWCGEVMEMYFRLDGNRIAEASFWADGCLSTMACGDMLMAVVRGMALGDAVAITPEELIAALDGLPLKSHHCAELSVETLREAIASRQEG